MRNLLKGIQKRFLTCVQNGVLVKCSWKSTQSFSKRSSRKDRKEPATGAERDKPHYYIKVTADYSSKRRKAISSPLVSSCLGG
jgi:hypothetical protein